MPHAILRWGGRGPPELRNFMPRRNRQVLPGFHTQAWNHPYRRAVGLGWPFLSSPGSKRKPDSSSGTASETSRLTVSSVLNQKFAHIFFFLAQAFTPGLPKPRRPVAPFQGAYSGGCSPRRAKSPVNGAGEPARTAYPGVNAWAREKHCTQGATELGSRIYDSGR